LTQGSIGIEQRRARLADIERELARLQYRHDIAMSAFRFEEATALDRERQTLAADLPRPPAEPETGVVPALARPRRPARRR
jgi:hypothetical protein